MLIEFRLVPMASDQPIGISQGYVTLHEESGSGIAIYCNRSTMDTGHNLFPFRLLIEQCQPLLVADLNGINWNGLLSMVFN